MLAISVFDVAGKKIIDLGSIAVLARSHTQSIDMSRYNSGSYICDMLFSGSEGVVTEHAKLVNYLVFRNFMF